MAENKRNDLIARIDRLADSIAFVTNIGCVVIGGIMAIVVIAGVFALGFSWWLIEAVFIF